MNQTDSLYVVYGVSFSTIMPAGKEYYADVWFGDKTLVKKHYSSLYQLGSRTQHSLGSEVIRYLRTVFGVGIDTMSIVRIEKAAGSLTFKKQSDGSHVV